MIETKVPLKFDLGPDGERRIVAHWDAVVRLPEVLEAVRARVVEEMAREYIAAHRQDIWAQVDIRAVANELAAMVARSCADGLPR